MGSPILLRTGEEELETRRTATAASSEHGRGMARSSRSKVVLSFRRLLLTDDTELESQSRGASSVGFPSDPLATSLPLPIGLAAELPIPLASEPFRRSFVHSAFPDSRGEYSNRGGLSSNCPFSLFIFDTKEYSP